MEFTVKGPVTLRTEDGEEASFDGPIRMRTAETPEIAKPKTGSSCTCNIYGNCSSSNAGEQAPNRLRSTAIEDLSVDELRELLAVYRTE